MNRRIFKLIYFSVLLILLFSCKEEEDIVQSSYFGEAQAIQNNQTWSSEVRSGYSVDSRDYMNLTFDRFENEFLRTHFHFPKVSLHNRDFQFVNSGTFLDCGNNICTTFSTGFNDQINDIYEINIEDVIEDWIVIDSFDDQTREFSGRFQASLVIDDSFIKVDNFPDTLIFENGTFNGRVNER